MSKWLLVFFCLLNVPRGFASVDPCMQLLEKHGSLEAFLKPEVSLAELEMKMRFRDEIRIPLALRWGTRFSIENRALQPGLPQIVVVKYFLAADDARKNALLLREYQEWKFLGFIAGFDINHVLKEGRTWNIFPFYEGRDLASMVRDRRPRRIPAANEAPEIRSIWESYLERLTAVKDKFTAGGFKVMGRGQNSAGLFTLDDPVNALPSLEVIDTEGKVFLRIHPGNVWVTSDGRYVILDPY